MRLRPGIWLAVAAGAALLAAGVAEAPRVLRRVSAFEIRQVEVRGLRHLPPRRALATAGIRPGANLFDDTERWQRALMVHPLVQDVRLRRRPPATLVVEVQETEPVLLVGVPALVPVDAAGRVLPIVPGKGSLDLPVLRGEASLAEGRIAQPELLAAVAEYDRLRRLDPTLAARVSEVGASDGVVELLLRRPAGLPVRLAAGAPPAQLRRLAVVLDEVAAAADAGAVTAVDARYGGQVVVAAAKRPGSS